MSLMEKEWKLRQQHDLHFPMEGKPITFFYLYQQNKSSESKVKFRQAINPCKKVLEAPKIAYGNKTREFITSQKLGSLDFWQIANSFLFKGKSAIPPIINSTKAYALSLPFWMGGSHFERTAPILSVFPEISHFEMIMT